jgi:hypothetical protein
LPEPTRKDSAGGEERICAMLSSLAERSGTSAAWSNEGETAYVCLWKRRFEAGQTHQVGLPYA